MTCHYCSGGKHRQCRRLRIDGRCCECDCDYAKHFREDAELYYRLDKLTAAAVFERLFPWKRPKTLQA